VQSANTSFDTLLEALLSTARSASPGGPASKQAFHSTAQCAAVLCLAAGEAMCSQTVSMLVTTLRTSNGTDAVSYRPYLVFDDQVTLLVFNSSRYLSSSY
jgi:cullin-associated NEDD8-dissociated protein 1